MPVQTSGWGDATPGRILICLRWLTAACMFMCTPVVHGQWIDLNNEVPVEASGPDEWVASRWSWLHAFEAHEAHLLTTPSVIVEPDGKAAAPAVAAVGDIDALRAQAVRSLEALSQRGRPSELRQTAVLALGRIGGPQATVRLMQLLNDQDDGVGEAAWMALGLADTTQARRKLLDPGTLSPRQTLGWIVAIALMEKPPASVLKTLAELVKQNRDIEVARLALWALRVHHPPGMLDAARLIADQSTDPYLASEAILILGEHRQTTDLSMLKGILLTRGRGVIRATDALVASVGSSTPGYVHNQRGAKLASVRASAAIALGQYVIPPEDKYSSRAREALRMIFENPPPPLLDPRIEYKPALQSGFGSTALMTYEIRLAAVALGQIGYKDDIDLLIRVLRTPRLSTVYGRAIDARHFLRRGHAALGLGIYLRRMTQLGITMQATADATDTQRSAEGDRALWARNGPLEGENPDDTRYILRKTLRALIDIAGDPKEPYDLRAACLLAMGMSDSPPRKADIIAVLDSPAGQHPVVAAYGMLGLAMLGHEQTLAGAAKLLKDPPRETLTTAELVKMGFAYPMSTGQVMTTRALLQAVGKIESPDAAALALGQFGQEPITSRQAVLTLRLLGDVRLAPALMGLIEQYPELARQDTRTNVRAPARPAPAQMAQLAAWSLGHLLRPQVEDRLARVMQQGSNYTLPLAPTRQGVEKLKRTNAIYRLRCHADPVFYEALAPCVPARSDLPFRF